MEGGIRMRESEVKVGMRIVINDIKGTKGFNVAREHIDNRALHARGIILGYISGHGGEVYAVKHDNGSIAVYHYSEFERIKNKEVRI
jgi:hypothetical protein